MRLLFLWAKYIQATALSNGSRHVHLDEPGAASLITRRRGMKCGNSQLFPFSFFTASHCEEQEEEEGGGLEGER